MIYNLYSCSSRELIIRTEFSECGSCFTDRHEVASTSFSANTYRPIDHMSVISLLTCGCGHLASELLLTKITLVDPTNEVQINRRYWRTYYIYSLELLIKFSLTIINFDRKRLIIIPSVNFSLSSTEKKISWYNNPLIELCARWTQPAHRVDCTWTQHLTTANTIVRNNYSYLSLYNLEPLYTSPLPYTVDNSLLQFLWAMKSVYKS